jgi:hypothetical protein
MNFDRSTPSDKESYVKAEARYFDSARPIGLIALTIAVFFALVSSAAAAPSRAYETSLGSFGVLTPQSVAVDQNTGELYGTSSPEETLTRVTATGAPSNFTAGPDAGTNVLTGLSLEGPMGNQVAIDAAGNIYVAELPAGVVKIFAHDGSVLGTLNGSATPGGSFSEPCGVAVDQATGKVYVGDYGNGVWRYTPAGATAVNSDFSGGIDPGFNVCQVAADNGNVYAANWDSGGPVRKYADSAFATGPPPTPSSTLIDPVATTMTVDPSTGEVYVDEGDRISVFDSSGAHQYDFGAGDFGDDSAGVAVKAGGNAYVGDIHIGGREIDVYTPILEPGTRAHIGSLGSFGSLTPQSVAVDQSTGELYGTSSPEGTVTRVTATGAPSNFTAGPDAGTNLLTGLSFEGPMGNQVAIDAAGNIYVAELPAGVVKIFAHDGSVLGTLNGSATPGGSFSEPCGVAVDQATGKVYVGDYGNGVWRYTPAGATAINSDFSGGINPGFNVCLVAA